MSSGVSSRHLVEERLELVIGVLVEQRYADALLVREPLGAGDAGEASPITTCLVPSSLKAYRT